MLEFISTHLLHPLGHCTVWLSLTSRTKIERDREALVSDDSEDSAVELQAITAANPPPPSILLPVGEVLMRCKQSLARHIKMKRRGWHFRRPLGVHEVP